jgi:hypothetical protein
MRFQLGIDVDIRGFSENGPPAKRKNDNYDRQAVLCKLYNRADSVNFIVQIAKTM